MNFLLLNLIVALLFTALTILIIGIFVLSKSKGNKTNKIFAFYSFSIAWWAFFQAFANLADTQQMSAFWSVVTMIGAWFIPAFFVHFVFSFLNINNKNIFLIIGYILSGFFSGVLLIPSFSITAADVTHRFFLKYWVTASAGGVIYYIATSFFFIYTFYGLFKLYKAYRTSSGAKHNQLAYLFWGSLFGYLGGASNFLLVYNVYIPVMHPFGTYLAPIYVFTIAYAITRYQLMDIKLIIKKAFFYSIGVGLVGGFITTITFLSYWFVANIPGFKFWTIPLIAAILTFWLGNLFWRKSKQVERAYIIEKQAHKELLHLSEVKDQFILATQHHLRTPLTIMKGYLSAILDKDKTLQTQTKDRLFRVSVSTDRLVKLVNELLDISQLQVGKQPLNIHPINIRDIIDEILNEFQQEIQTKNLNIKLIPTNKQDWPLIPADLEKLKIALSNLIDNAVKYTPHQSKLGAGQAPKGEIIIQGKTINSSFQVAIKDNGIGVNPEEIPTLFTKYFERGEQAQKLYTTGRGIGLFIAASIIKAHNGRVWAESEGTGKGSVFYVEMPIMS